jgi:hypothetical protein
MAGEQVRSPFRRSDAQRLQLGAIAFTVKDNPGMYGTERVYSRCILAYLSRCFKFPNSIILALEYRVQLAGCHQRTDKMDRTRTLADNVRGFWILRVLRWNNHHGSRSRRVQGFNRRECE